MRNTLQEQCNLYTGKCRELTSLNSIWKSHLNLWHNEIEMKRHLQVQRQWIWISFTSLTFEPFTTLKLSFLSKLLKGIQSNFQRCHLP